MTLDERIPEAMKDIGFSVVKSGGAETILLPALEVVPWHANKNGKPGEGRYKTIEFDEESKTAHLETEDGEISDITVDVHNNVVRTRSVAEGRDEHMHTLTYEKDQNAVMWVNPHLNHVKGISMDYDHSTKSLKVTKDGKDIYNERLNLPDGVNIEVVTPWKAFLRVTDQGRNFSKYINCGWAQGIPESYKSDHILFALNAEALERDGIEFDYFLSSEGRGEGLKESSSSIPDTVDSLMRRTFYDELHKGSASIDVEGKQLTVFGPNRKGEYRLSSGKSSVAYNPQTGDMEFSGGTQSYISTTVSGRLEDGELMLKDTFTPQSGGGHQLWKLKLNFGNTDPSKSYSAELVEDTHTKSE